MEKIKTKKIKAYWTQLEKYVFDRLTEAGWEVVCEPQKLIISDNRRYTPDFAIYYNGELYGYVEAISLLFSRERLLEKIEIAKNVIQNYNPFLFIITDGKNIYLYTKERTYTIHYFVGPLAFVEEYKIYKGSNK